MTRPKTKTKTGLTGTNYTATRVRGLAPWRPQAKTAPLIADIKDVLTTYRAYWPLTSRQIGYRLLSYPGYTKSDGHFEKVGEVLNRGRRSGVFRWEAIRDDGLSLGHDLTFDSPADFHDYLNDRANDYKRDRQEGQDQYLEIWVEAAGMVPQVASFTEDFSVPVLSSSGFDSVTIKRERALTIAVRDVPTIIGLIGDHDQHGLAVIDSRSDDIETFVVDFTEPGRFKGSDGSPLTGSVEFVWLAVKPEQIAAPPAGLGLPTAPTGPGKDGKEKQRMGDSEYARTDTVQAEAIDPADLRDIVRDFITDYVDEDIRANIISDEEFERDGVVEKVEALSL